MLKYKIQLADGIMDFSGAEITYQEDVLNTGIPPGPRLPYTVREIREAKKPEAFFQFIHDNFPDEKTRETLLYYLSLIPARETDFKYCGVFYGGVATGKTATIEVIREVLPGFFENIPGECFFRRAMIQPYQPHFPDIEGKGACVVTEILHNKPIYTPLIEILTGGDTITTRELYQSPKSYVPTAQLIICTNKVIDFGHNDEVMESRLLVIPFLEKHERGHPQTKTFSEIFIDLQGEFPGIVKLLIEYYIRLKGEHRGAIPQSDECLKYKKRFIRMIKPGGGITMLNGLKKCVECGSLATEAGINGRCLVCGGKLE